MAKTSAALSFIPGGAGSPAAPTDDLVDAVQNFIDAKIAPLREKILLQQAEIEALKSRPSPQIDGFIARSGVLVLTRGDGTVREAGVVVGRDGKDGEPGMGFDDMTVEFDGHRCLTFLFTRGEKRKELKFALPSPIYKEVYRPEETYFLGDMVSFGGSIWSCMVPATTTKPGQGNPHWKLACKHGRDGRDGKSAFEIAVDAGFRGSESDWLKSLKGPPGKDGKGFAP